jgi:hypothetical protein
MVVWFRGFRNRLWLSVFRVLLSHLAVASVDLREFILGTG